MKLTSLILSLFMAIQTVTGCASLTPDVYKPLLDSDAPIATVRAVSASFHEIDGRRLKHPDPTKYYNEAHLPPGSHDLSLTRFFMVSAMIVPRGYIEPISPPITVDLEADHTYELHADRTTGQGFRVYFWIEDAATGDVVAGVKLY